MKTPLITSFTALSLCCGLYGQDALKPIESKNTPLEISLLSGVDDGFGLGLKLEKINLSNSKSFISGFTLEGSANLLSDPDESNLDHIRLDLGYPLKSWGKISQGFITDPVTGLKVPKGLQGDILTFSLDAHFASTQEFENYEYGIGASLTFQSIYLRDAKYLPFNMVGNLFKAFGAKGPVSDQAVTFGISYDLVKTELEMSPDGETHRLGFFAESAWQVPVADLLTVSYRGAYDIDQDKLFSYVAAKLDFYSTDTGIANLPTTFSLYYKYGELAPTFESGKEIGLGISIKY